MKQATYPIKGMHCASCEILIGEELDSLPDILHAQVSLKTKSATIYARHLPPRQAVRRAVEAAGYQIGYDAQEPFINPSKRVYKDLAIGLIAVAILALLYTTLGLADASNISTGGAGVGVVGLLMGFTAGFSTCMALIGGLVLGIAAKHAEKHPTARPLQKFRPHIFFNLGRIASFIVLGGVIGALGAAFSLKGSLLGLLTLAVGVVMFVLGLQLTELFPRLKGRLTLPSSIAQRLGIKERAAREYSHKDAMVLGAATFFLPCGFTQAMQLFAVSTGSAISGAIIRGRLQLVLHLVCSASVG
jgi:sulfite exporter TauE/SafE/copper chaperone CopZ